MISALEKLTWPKRYSAGAALAAATLALQRSGTEVARRIRVTAAGRKCKAGGEHGLGPERRPGQHRGSRLRLPP